VNLLSVWLYKTYLLEDDGCHAPMKNDLFCVCSKSSAVVLEGLDTLGVNKYKYVGVINLLYVSCIVQFHFFVSGLKMCITSQLYMYF
jgi:hypothetical protein